MSRKLVWPEFATWEVRRKLGQVNFHKDYWDFYWRLANEKAPADVRGVSSNYPRNDCGTHLGSSFLLVSNVVNVISINGAEQVLRPLNLNFFKSLFYLVYLFFFLKVWFILPICLPRVICRMCVTRINAVSWSRGRHSSRVAWLVYVRTYCKPITTLNQNKRAGRRPK